jgi:hypothetical protein
MQNKDRLIIDLEVIAHKHYDIKTVDYDKFKNEICKLQNVTEIKRNKKVKSDNCYGEYTKHVNRLLKNSRVIEICGENDIFDTPNVAHIYCSKRHLYIEIRTDIAYYPNIIKLREKKL